MVKYLVELGFNPEFGMININLDNELAFKICCTEGYLEIAKYLIKLGLKQEFGMINIHVDNDEAFKLCYENNHQNMIKWLIRLGNTDNYKSFSKKLIKKYHNN